MGSEADNPQPVVGDPRRRHPRFHHRQRSHDSAHAGSAEVEAETISVDHHLVPNGKAVLIDNAADLDSLVKTLRAAGSFAYDSEFIGEQSYLPKLCLIQTAIPGGVSLIDPLAGMDVTPFWELVCETSVEKVVHAGEQD